MSCSNNLKQLGLATHNYHSSVGKFPPGVNVPAVITNLSGGQSSPPPLVAGQSFSLFEALLPYIEQNNVYSQLNFVGPISVNGNTGNDSEYVNCATATNPSPVGSTIIKTFLCPSDTAPTQTTYVGTSGVDKGLTYLFGANTYGGCAGIRSFYTFDTSSNPTGTGMTQDGIFYINSSVSISQHHRRFEQHHRVWRTRSRRSELRSGLHGRQRHRATQRLGLGQLLPGL